MKSIRFATGRSYGAARADLVLAIALCSPENASTQRGGYNTWRLTANPPWIMRGFEPMENVWNSLLLQFAM